MLWIKSFHIIFMVTWFAGLFYLPRLFVYHAMSKDTTSRERFKVMERKLFFGIMTPGALLTIGSGLWLWLGYGFNGGWLHAKMAVVVMLVAYHIYCGKLLTDFRHERDHHRAHHAHALEISSERGIQQQRRNAPGEDVEVRLGQPEHRGMQPPSTQRRRQREHDERDGN